jgi:dephospho-CoA kinase
MDRERTASRSGTPRRGSLGTRAPVIGVIGPIGSGKSTVSARLAERGAVVVDADQLTRQLMTPSAGLTEEIIARFGVEFRLPDGSLDRAALGRLVFSDVDRLAELESIVHPVVEELERATILAADSRGPVAIVVEAIKLVEAGHAGWCDEVWLVVCAPDTQLARLVGRGMPETDARQRIAAQAASLPLWHAAATRVIETDGTLDEVRAAVDVALDRVISGRTG